jgi:uncharacterized repeat protein (TIGR01451 family)
MEAVAAANATTSARIEFNIPKTAEAGFDAASGTFAIQPPGEISLTANGTVIDGSSQAAAQGDSNPNGPEIILRGNTAAGGGGIEMTAANCQVKGLVVQNYSQDGITISGDAATGNFVQGCYIGTNHDGTAPVANARGVHVRSGATGNTIGGSAPGEGNLISGNSFNGAWFSSDGNTLQGNFIGTTRTGNAALPNGGDAGLQITGNSNTIGGTSPGAGNVMAGNQSTNCYVSGDNNIFQGNRIGTNAAGTAAVTGGNIGIDFVYGATGNLLGGTVAGAGNIITRTRAVSFYQANGNTVQGNFIGVAADGTTALGSAGTGITIWGSSSNNVIGGTLPGAGNTIAFQSGSGVGILNDTQTASTGNSVRGNRIYNNTHLGINLSAPGDTGGVTPNDSGDADTGPNNLQNYPVITAITDSGGIKTITGTLNSTPNGTFFLDFYASPAADATGYGEGANYLGSLDGSNQANLVVTTDTNGNGSFSFTTSGAVDGPFFTATATNATGDTSEFSRAFASSAGALTLTVVPQNVNEDRGPNASTGTVTRLNSSTTSALTVSLSSDLAQVTVPATVQIPAGENSATFPIGVLEDEIINGTRSATITATAPGIAPANATLNVFDNDVRNLNLALTQSTFKEGQAPVNVATVTRTGSTTNPLTVSITASLAGQIVVPAEVVIPAGNPSVTFAVAAFDDAIADGQVALNITATAPDYNGSSVGVVTQDDDVAAIALSILPNPFAENAAPGSVLASVRRNTSLNTSVTVDIFNNQSERVQAPTVFVIPAGAETASFNLTPVDDSVVRGNVEFTLTAVAREFVSTSGATATMTEDDAPSLSLTTQPTTLREGDGSTGSLNLNFTQAEERVINLSSNNPALQVPATVTVAAGQSSAFFFALAVNDAIASGNRTATVVASSPGLPNSEVTFTIEEDDTAQLFLSVAPATIFENAGATAATGTLRRNTPANVELVVNLSSSNPERLTVPASVTIPAGSDSVTFPIGAVDNENYVAGQDKTEVTLSAGANGHSAAQAQIVIQENDLPTVTECETSVINLEAGKTKALGIPVAAAPDLWISLQPKEQPYNINATLTLNNQPVDVKRFRPYYGSELLHVTNPQAGTYKLELSASWNIELVVRTCADLPNLPLNQTVIRKIYHNDGSDWLQMDVPAGVQKIDFLLETIGNISVLEVFRGGMQANLVASGNHYFNPPVTTSLENPAPGRYYIRVYDHGDIGSQTGSQVRDYSLTANATLTTAPPSPIGIVPNRGGNSGSVRATISGSNFDARARVKLTKAGVPEIIGADISRGSDGDSLGVTFDLFNRAPGVYNVVVTNEDGRSFTLPNAFTVLAGGEADVWVEVIGRTRIRIGREQTFIVNYGNRGNVDAHAVPLWIAGIPKNATVRLGFELTAAPPAPGETAADAGDISPLVKNAEENEQILPLIVPRIPAGTSSSFRLFITVPDSTPFTLESWMYAPIVERQAAQASGTNTFTTRAVVTRAIVSQCTKDLAGAAFKAVGLFLPAKCATTLAFLIGPVYAAAADTARGDAFRAPISQKQLVYSLIKAAAVCALDFTALGKIAAFLDFYLSLDKIRGSCMGPKKSPGRTPVAPVGAYDPNDKVGPRGHGAPHYISGQEPLPYTIFFENKSTATAPAEQVLITDQLDVTKYDLNSFTLGMVTFGNTTVTPPPGLSEWTTQVDLRPAKPTIVNIHGELNKRTGVITWRFNSIDPETGLTHDDPDAGFLPPNKISTEGQGSVSFTIRAKSNLAVNSVLRNKARIIFDTNEHIDTPEWINTIEYTRPSSRVLALPALQYTENFPVKWSGTDTGSGLQRYSIYVSENNAPYTLWQDQTTATSAIFTGSAGKTYRFYSVAHDGAGNVELAPTTPDAVTTLASVNLAVTLTDSPDPVRLRTRVTYTMTVGNTGPQNGTNVVATLRLPVGVIYNSATSTRGTCTQANGLVTCNIGSLTRGATARITVVVTPPVGGLMRAEANVRGREPDPNSANNRAIQETIVTPYVRFTTPSAAPTPTGTPVATVEPLPIVVKELPFVAGTAQPVAGSGITRVDLLIQRVSDGKYWTGTAWGARTPLATTLSPLAGGVAGSVTWTRRNAAGTLLPNGANLPDGAYVFTAIVTDRSTDSGAAILRVNVDKALPVSVTITRPANGSFLNQLASAAGTAVDNLRGSGISAVKVSLRRRLDGKFWTGTGWGALTLHSTDLTPGSATGSVNWTWAERLPTLSLLLNGQYILTAVATDRAGNSRTGVASTFTVDKTAPVVVFATPLSNSVVTQLPRVSGRITDAGGSGVSRVQLFIQRSSDGKFWTGSAWGNRTALSTTLSSGVWTRSTGLPSVAFLLEGNYTLQAHGFDHAGNRTIAISNIVVRRSTTGTTTNTNSAETAPVEEPVATTAARSSARLSSVGVRTGDNLVTFSFNMALDAEVAVDAQRYTVLVNGQRVDVESAAYSAPDQRVSLWLAEGSLRSGDRVTVQWNELLDRQGRVVVGEAGPITAQ